MKHGRIKAPDMVKSVSEDSMMVRRTHKARKQGGYRESSAVPSLGISGSQIELEVESLGSRESEKNMSKTPEPIAGPSVVSPPVISFGGGVAGSSVLNTQGHPSFLQGRVEQVLFENLPRYESLLFQGLHPLSSSQGWQSFVPLGLGRELVSK
jgi:hypothetical protein